MGRPALRRRTQRRGRPGPGEECAGARRVRVRGPHPALFRAIPDFDEVRKTRPRQDGGIDVVAVNKKEFASGRVDVQAKCYHTRHKVAIAEVREMVESISQREFHKEIIVITTSGYTSAAREEAARLGIELYDGERLLWLLRHHLHREYTIIDTDRRKAPIGAPPHASGRNKRPAPASGAAGTGRQD